MTRPLTEETKARMLALPGECWDALAILDFYNVRPAEYGDMLRFMGKNDAN